MSLSEAFAAALSALSAPGNNGERIEFAAAQLEVAILDRARDHRTFRRIRAARLEELLAEARPAPAPEAAADDESSAESSGTAPSGTGPGSSTPPGSSGPSSPSSPSDTEPPTGPAPGGSDRGTGLDGGSPL